VFRDATSKAGQECVVASLRGNTKSFTASIWPQDTEAAAETHTCTIEQLDDLESVYAEIYRAALKKCSTETAKALTTPRARGASLKGYCDDFSHRIELNASCSCFCCTCCRCSAICEKSRTGHGCDSYCGSCSSASDYCGII